MGLSTRLIALAALEESVAEGAPTSRSDRSASGLASLPRHVNTDPARPPAFPFSPGDWLRNTALRSCSLAARGLWVDLLCFMHSGTPFGHLAVAGKGAIPEDQLAQLVGLPVSRFQELLAELERAGLFAQTPEGIIYSRQMVRDDQLRQARSAGQRRQPKPARDDTPFPLSAGASGSKESARRYPPAFDHTWEIYPRRAGGNSKVAAFRAWSARVKDGITPEDLHAGVERYAAYCRATGNVGTPYVKQAATFFGPDEHFREPWAVGGAAGRARTDAFTLAEFAEAEREALNG